MHTQSTIQPMMYARASTMKPARMLPGVLLALLLAACGKSAPAANAASTTATPDAQTSPIAPAASPPAQASVSPAAPPPAARGGLAARTGELTNPDDAQMVFLYYDLTGMAPPVDRWVEHDGRVNYAPAAQKAAGRVQVKAEIEAGLAAVRDVGIVHLTTNARLSQYDPTYGEFTIGALSPSTMFTFRKFDQSISLKLDNGLTAQTWSVPKAESQPIIDKLDNANPMLEATLKITRVLPVPGGGTLVAHVVSWTLRDGRSGNTLARITVPSH